MPSPLVSRNKLILLALGCDEPARFITSFMIFPLIPLLSSGLGGASVSATNTSPLGNTYSQRGCCSCAAKACTFNPAAGVGIVPVGQPLAGAIFTVGSKLDFGSGKRG